MPALSVNTYGCGRVWYLNYPIEDYTAKTPNAVYEGLHQVYDLMALRSGDRVAKKFDPYVGMTEHTAGDKRILVLINYEPEDRSASVELMPGWQLEKAFPLGSGSASQRGTTVDLQLGHNSGISLILKQA